jgi:hypothetical protein
VIVVEAKTEPCRDRETAPNQNTRAAPTFIIFEYCRPSIARKSGTSGLQGFRREWAKSKKSSCWVGRLRGVRWQLSLWCYVRCCSTVVLHHHRQYLYGEFRIITRYSSTVFLFLIKMGSRLVGLIRRKRRRS